MQQSIIWFKDLSLKDIEQVGGKNASLGEMFNHLNQLGIKIPNGFATTAEAYRDFLKQNGLQEKINGLLATLDTEDIAALSKTGQLIREWIMNASFSSAFVTEITQAYEQLMQQSGNNITVAVRSSATAEDLPNASFAGQQETYLNISGKENLLFAIKQVFASLFNDRAIAYRVHHQFDHAQVALSAGIQRMVRSDQACSGVMFSVDTESGFEEVILITGSYGLGETVVQGSVNPDEFYVHKPTLKAKKPAILRRNVGSKLIKMVYSDTSEQSVTVVPVPEKQQAVFCLNDEEVLYLAKQALLIEEHYQRPMDIEWAKDGVDGQIYILQARPETVTSHQHARVIERYQLETHDHKVLISGRSIGQRIGQGKAKILRNASEMEKVQAGDVLVTDMTDPDWEPVMKRAAAIVTNRGGRTCHAAIIARELGIPAIVGCGNATQIIADNADITVSCAEGDTGQVYEGLIPFKINQIHLEHMPELPFKIMLNVGDPDHAFTFQRLPNMGIGLARVEFIINRMIGIHPKALLEYSSLPADLQQKIAARIQAYASPIEYYVERLKEGIATIAAAFYPKPVIVRLSDFKTNEYANLLGGELYEPHEENPMIGFRGASRYAAPAFHDCFELECRALKRVRDEMGLTNVEIMIPFVRTLNEAKQVTELLAKNDLSRGKNDLRLIMMCEIPSNALLAEQFLEYFDGFSIGSNDLTQLTLGLDRDSGLVASLFDERDPAVKILLAQAIQACKKAGKYIGICGQGPSDHPDLAQWLMEQGIDSVSLNPDCVLDTWIFLGEHLA